MTANCVGLGRQHQEPVPGLGQAFDDLDDLLAPESVVPGEVEEIPGAGEDGAALGGARHGDAASAAELQQAFVSEEVQGAQDGIFVDAQYRGEILSQGQALAGVCLAVGDGAADLRGHLIVQGCGIGRVDVDIQHGPSDSSSMRLIWQRP